MRVPVPYAALIIPYFPVNPKAVMLHHLTLKTFLLFSHHLYRLPKFLGPVPPANHTQCAHTKHPTKQSLSGLTWFLAKPLLQKLHALFTGNIRVSTGFMKFQKTPNTIEAVKYLQTQEPKVYDKSVALPLGSTPDILKSAMLMSIPPSHFVNQFSH